MSIEYIQGDLLTFPNGISVIAHSANCRNTFGSGLAKQIREEFPAAYEADTEFHEKARGLPDHMLGMYSRAEVAGKRYVCNLYSQASFGRDRRYVDYEALYLALYRLREDLETAHTAGRPWILGLPHNISCGTAGGSWTVVNAMIQDLFAASPVKVYVVELVKKETAP